MTDNSFIDPFYGPYLGERLSFRQESGEFHVEVHRGDMNYYPPDRKPPEYHFNYDVAAGPVRALLAGQSLFNPILRMMNEPIVITPSEPAVVNDEVYIAEAETEHALIQAVASENPVFLEPERSTIKRVKINKIDSIVIAHVGTPQSLADRKEEIDDLKSVADNMGFVKVFYQVYASYADVVKSGKFFFCSRRVPIWDYPIRGCALEFNPNVAVSIRAQGFSWSEPPTADGSPSLVIQGHYQRKMVRWKYEYLKKGRIHRRRKYDGKDYDVPLYRYHGFDFITNVRRKVTCRNSSIFNVLCSVNINTPSVPYTSNTLYAVCPNRLRFPCERTVTRDLSYRQGFLTILCSYEGNPPPLLPDGSEDRHNFSGLMAMDIIQPQMELLYRQKLLSILCLERSITCGRPPITKGYTLASTIGGVYLKCNIYDTTSVGMKMATYNVPSKWVNDSGKWRLLLNPVHSRFRVKHLTFQEVDGLDCFPGTEVPYNMHTRDYPYCREYSSYAVLIPDPDGIVYVPRYTWKCDIDDNRVFIDRNGLTWHKYTGPLCVSFDSSMPRTFHRRKFLYALAGEKTTFYYASDTQPVSHYEVCAFRGVSAPIAAFNGLDILMPSPVLFGNSVHDMPFKRMTYDEVWKSRDYLYDVYGNIINVGEELSYIPEDDNYPVFDHYGNIPHSIYRQN